MYLTGLLSLDAPIFSVDHRTMYIVRNSCDTHAVLHVVTTSDIATICWLKDCYQRIIVTSDLQIVSRHSK